MKRFCILLLIVAFVATAAVAQKPAHKGKMDSSTEKHWSGNVVGVDQAKSMLTIERDKNIRTCEFDSSTKWTKGTASADLSEFKAGVHVVCVGTVDAKSGHLKATRIDLRPGK